MTLCLSYRSEDRFESNPTLTNGVWIVTTMPSPIQSDLEAQRSTPFPSLPFRASWNPTGRRRVQPNVIQCRDSNVVGRTNGQDAPMPSDAKLAAVKTNIPARLDRFPWCRFHVLIIVALGITWILDGLEVTIVGSIGPVLQDSQTLALSAQQIGAAASSYVVGAVCGALIFGWLADRPVREEVRVLCHADRLSDRRFAHRRVLEFLELRRVPGDHGHGDRRRICRD
jgi:hypothetical protein